jgi:hypothetical protein
VCDGIGWRLKSFITYKFITQSTEMSASKVIMLQRSLETIWSILPSMAFNEEKLRPREGKEFGLSQGISDRGRTRR